MEVKTESGGSFNAAGNGTTALGIIGTVLGGLATAMSGGNGLLNMNGNAGKGCPNANDSNTFVTKAELQMTQELASKDSQIALLKSEQNTEIKIADVFERLITRINSDQSVNNATMSAAIASNATSIAALQNSCNQITKLVVPNTSICPGWGTVTITPATTTTTT